MSNAGKLFVIGTKCGIVSSFLQCVRQVCTVTLAALPEGPTGKTFRFTTHQHRLRLLARELVNAASPIKQNHHRMAKPSTQACRSIELEEEKLDLAKLAASVGLSPSHFQRIFKAQVGLSQKQYAMALWKQHFHNKLKFSKNVTQTIYEAGYYSSSRAYADNTKSGLMPSKYKKEAQEETIHYAYHKTILGSILIATTDRGICLVEFAEKEEVLGILEANFPSAELQEAEEDWKEWISEVVAQIDDPHRRQSNEMTLPLDIRGTVFQEKAWQGLTEIPSGETVSYTKLAQSLGQPKAVRAVARACASNRLAVLVPCHRVIRGSGDLAGYKWGIERKQKILEQEKNRR